MVGNPEDRFEAHYQSLDNFCDPVFGLSRKPLFIWNSGALDVFLEQKMMSLGKPVQHRIGALQFVLKTDRMRILQKYAHRFVGSVHWRISIVCDQFDSCNELRSKLVSKTQKY